MPPLSGAECSSLGTLVWKAVVRTQPDTRLAYLGTLQLSEAARWGFRLSLPYLVGDLAVQRGDVTRGGVKEED